ncbi:GntR family transcriptional regulator [Mycolicibacterium mucogenicum]|uniref:GntR family transcriptional regulator n=1 Tax=Mycolicibacterium mucogenicum TaxID=56689 RepID=A0A1A3GKE8_MYCMU|nr:GntR family transcriptional regulator [Mycolicibacterium mucogenicum]
MLIELDRTSGADALHRQLADGLRDAIRTGRLTPKTRLPSSRVLAADLQVSRRLVVDAYSQLVAEGFLQSQQGSGTTVAAVDTATGESQPSRPDRRTFDIDFAPGVPDLSSFPRHSWLRALRQGLSSIESQSLGYVSSKGLPDARTAVSDYLRRTRGVRADPQRVVLCSGATQAVALLAHVVGDRAVAMENPGFWLHRMVFRHHGIEPVPVPVDDDGLDVAALANTAASAVLTTPAHQSPTGVVLSPARRTALLEWAREGNIVIEDDYDAEYRYDRAPVGALHALAPDRVVYLGSVSKTLAPGLRLGWMVLPPDLVGPVVSAKSLADTGSSVMDQLAFATLLRSGDYDRHLRLMRRRYLARRNALLAALGRYLPEAKVLGAAAGVHLTVRLPTDCDVDDIVRESASQRVRIDPLSWCYTEPDCAPPGLILGYANLTESQIDTGVRAIAAAVARET